MVYSPLNFAPAFWAQEGGWREVSCWWFLSEVDQICDMLVLHPISQQSELIMTCQLQVTGSGGSAYKARALADSASGASFITERLAQCLHHPHCCSDKHTNTFGRGMHGTSVSTWICVSGIEILERTQERGYPKGTCSSDTRNLVKATHTPGSFQTLE